MGRYVESQAYEVTDSPVEISAGEGGVYPVNRRTGFIVENVGDAEVFIGNENVTKDNGFPLTTQAVSPFNSRVDLGRFTGSLWAVTESGTSKIRTLEVS